MHQDAKFHQELDCNKELYTRKKTIYETYSYNI